MISNYEQIEQAIRTRAAFTGNSSFGMLVNRGEHLWVYEVYSYRTKIAEYSNKGTVWVSPEFYSKTTSRLQNICRRVWEV